MHNLLWFFVCTEECRCTEACRCGIHKLYTQTTTTIIERDAYLHSADKLSYSTRRARGNSIIQKLQSRSTLQYPDYTRSEFFPSSFRNSEKQRNKNCWDVFALQFKFNQAPLLSFSKFVSLNSCVVFFFPCIGDGCQIFVLLFVEERTTIATFLFLSVLNCFKPPKEQCYL